MKWNHAVIVAGCISVVSLCDSPVYAQHMNIIEEEPQIKYVHAKEVLVKKFSSDIAVTVARLKKNEQVEVIEVKDEWANIKFGDVEGFVEDKYLMESGEVEAIKFIDNTSQVKIYSDPNKSSDVEDIAILNDKIAILDSNTYKGYAKVLYKNKIGFVRYSEEIFVDILKRTVKGGSYIYRDSLMDDKSEKFYIENDENVDVLDIDKNVAKIALNNEEWYIDASFLYVIKYSNNDNSAIELKVEPNEDSSVRTIIPKGADLKINKYGSEYTDINYGDYHGYIKNDDIAAIKPTINVNEETVVLLNKDTNIYDLKKLYHDNLKEYIKLNKVDLKVDSKEVEKEKLIKAYNEKFIKDNSIIIANKDNVIYTENLGKVYTVIYNENEYITLNNGNNDNFTNIVYYPSKDITSKTRYVKEDALVYKDKKSNETLGVLNKDAQVEYVSKANDRVEVLLNNYTVYINKKDLVDTKMYTQNIESKEYINTGKSHTSYVKSQAKKLNTSSKDGGFVASSYNDIVSYSNPKTYKDDEKYRYQFLKLNTYREVNVSKLNDYLNSINYKGKVNVFKNKADVFVNAAKEYNIDVLYLVSHTILETGHGSSKLSQGSKYKGVTVYNFFGIGAVDSNAYEAGVHTAYSQGWTSIDNTIYGSAKWISENYINSKERNQNTLYKMRFNYQSRSHQYASDVAWACKISSYMYKLEHLYEDTVLEFEIPVFTDYAKKKKEVIKDKDDSKEPSKNEDDKDKVENIARPNNEVQDGDDKIEIEIPSNPNDEVPQLKPVEDDKYNEDEFMDEEENIINREDKPLKDKR